MVMVKSIPRMKKGYDTSGQHPLRQIEAQVFSLRTIQEINDLFFKDLRFELWPSVL